MEKGSSLGEGWRRSPAWQLPVTAPPTHWQSRHVAESMSTSALLPSPAPTAQLASLQLPQPQLPAWAVPPSQPQTALTGHITLLPGHAASCDGDSMLPLGTAQMATAQHTHLLQEAVWEPLTVGKSLCAPSSSQQPLCRSAPTLSFSPQLTRRQ